MSSKEAHSRRVAIYARTSTNRQDIELQLVELRDYAGARGWELVDEFVDEGVSSRRIVRPRLAELKKACRQRQVDVVLVWRFDRFARSLRELVEALEEFRALQVDFLSFKEAVDTSTPAGRALFAMIAMMAEFERELIRERVNAGVAKARRDGKTLGRPKRRFNLEFAKKLRGEGLSIRQVAERLEVPVSTLAARMSRPVCTEVPFASEP